MNDRPMTPVPGPDRGGTWLDAYMPETQMVPHGQQSDSLIDIDTIRGLIFRQRWLMAGVIVAAVVIGLIVTLLATPMYAASSTVRIEPYGSNIVEGQNIDPGISSNQVYELLATQVGIITSRSLAETVAEKKNLSERYDFLGQDIDDSRPPETSDEEWRAAKQSMATSILHGSVSSEVPESNWIITITYRSEDPVIAAEMANAYLEAYAASDTRSSIEDNEYAQEFLKEQIALTRARLSEAEKAANDYARSSGIIVQQASAEDDAPSLTLAGANLVSINARAAAATAARIEAEQRWRSVQNLPAAQLPEVQNNSTLQALITERTLKRTELANLRERYTDDFPQIVTLLSEVRNIDAQINSSSQDIKAAVRNQFAVARNQEQALQRELSAKTGDTLAEQDQQVEYNVLEREAQSIRDQLATLLTRFNQVSSATNVDTGTIRPLDTAIIPGAPYAPSLLQNMGLALVFGIAVAGGLAVLRETFDDRVRSLVDVEERLGLPLLGHTPFIEKGDLQSQETDRFSSLMEAYASIRSTIDFTLPRDGNVIQLTSSQEAEGKSTTAVILAELFASLGRKTLLIDADLRRPSVAYLLGLEKPKVGLVEVLLGHADLQSALIKGVHPNLEILPIGELPPNPTELLASSQLQDFISKYRNEYSLIIFDSCPVMGLADAPVLSRIVDSSIFVLEANRIQVGQAKAAIRRMQRAGGNVAGVILTKYRALEAGQSYNYQYGYYEYGSKDERH